MSHEEMPIFSRSFDLLTWLVAATHDFPRAHRFTITRRLLDAAFNFRERIEIVRELRLPGYVHYVDDLLLFSRSKAELWRARAAVIERLEGQRLTVHPEAHPRPVTEGIPFLGFVTFPQRRRLKGRKSLQFRHRLRAALAGYEAGELSGDRLAASVQGWLAHVRYGNTRDLQKAILKNLPAEILAMLGT